MYRFAVYTSRITFPLCFAKHSWVICESDEYGCNRYEIHAFKNIQTKNYFYKNSVSEAQGMSYFSLFFFAFSKAKFKGKKIFEVAGMEYKNLVLEIEEEIKKYPFKETYRLFPGPNSNTFTKWVIEKAGLAGRVQLPWNAFGKINKKIFYLLFLILLKICFFFVFVQFFNFF